MELTSVTQIPLDMKSTYAAKTVEPDVETEAVGSSSDVETEPSENQAAKAPKGVIRNLMNGHYKGVADLRLRINFADELNRITQSGKQASAVSGGAELVNTVGETLGALPESGAATEGLMNDFEAEIMAAADQSANPDSFELTLRSSFENLVDNLYVTYPSISSENEEIIEQTVTEPGVPAETTVAEETPQDTGSTPAIEAAMEIPGEAIAQTPETVEIQEPSVVEEIIEASEEAFAQDQVIQEAPADESPTDFDLDAFVEELRSAFETAMMDVMNALSGADTLPPLSEPNGNGKAYDKFLAIYHSIQNGGDPLPTTDQTAVIVETV